MRSLEESVYAEVVAIIEEAIAVCPVQLSLTELKLFKSLIELSLCVIIFLFGSVL